MKRIILFICLISFAPLAIANQIVSLTTGDNNPGTPDPFWTVTRPDLIFTTPIISTGQQQNASGSLVNCCNHALDPCGRWISPHVNTTPGPALGALTQNAQFGNYIYKRTFTKLASCAGVAVSNATINITKAGADNSITEFRINGNIYPVTGIVFNTLNPISISVNPLHIINGTNTIEVVVNNTNGGDGLASWTGLFLCGELSINYTPPPMTGNITGSTLFCQGTPMIYDASGSTGSIAKHNWGMAECDASGNLTNPAANWASANINGTPGTYNFSTAPMNFTPQCNKYYLIVLHINGGCDPNYWQVTTLQIFIKCKPNLLIHDPPPVCEGSTIMLSAGGNSTSYQWAPPVSAGMANVIWIANTSATYTVTGTLNGCTATATTTVVVSDANLDLNLSTGFNNTTGLLKPFGGNDDTWKIRGVPGTLYSSAIIPARVIQPYYSGAGSVLNWATSPTARWISSTGGAGGALVEVICSQSDISSPFNNNYWFEATFNLPISTYDNLRMELNDQAVDNLLHLYLNSNALTSTTPTNLEYSMWGYPSYFNFSLLHDPGTIALNQSHYQLGTNTLLAEVWNSSTTKTDLYSYMGLLMDLHVKGECLPTDETGHRPIIIPEEEMQYERMLATTFIYPNPSSGNFTVSCEGQTIESIKVKDAMGKTIKDFNNVNLSTIDISIGGTSKGLYFLEISYAGQKPVFKKIIVE